MREEGAERWRWGRGIGGRREREKERKGGTPPGERDDSPGNGGLCAHAYRRVLLIVSCYNLIHLRYSEEGNVRRQTVQAHTCGAGEETQQGGPVLWHPKRPMEQAVRRLATRGVALHAVMMPGMHLRPACLASHPTSAPKVVARITTDNDTTLL